MLRLARPVILPIFLPRPIPDQLRVTNPLPLLGLPVNQLDPTLKVAPPGEDVLPPAREAAFEM